MAELSWKGKSTITAAELCQQVATKSITTLPDLDSSGWHDVNSLPGWQNCLIHGDKSDLLPILLQDFKEAIDLIYIDPPFMTGRDFTGSLAGHTQLAYSDKWGKTVDTYLQWLYETFIILHALLARSGTLYVHLDWRAAHYAKVMLDEVFASGEPCAGAGFKNEIIWHYQSGGRAHHSYARKHDTILLYTKSDAYRFHGERVGERRGAEKRNHMRKLVGDGGRVTWTIRSHERIYEYDEYTLMTPDDVWSDISHLHQKAPERTGYATQKPSALLERIILASSEEGDIVLDCFCGSGVTPATAERLNRRWIACDKSALAIQVTNERLRSIEQVKPYLLQEVR